MNVNVIPPINVPMETITVLGMLFVLISQMRMMFQALNVNVNLDSEEMEPLVLMLAKTSV